MGLQSLPQLLNSISSQESWRGRRQFQALVGCWTEVVGEVVAAQTRPTGIQRQVLQVATASSAWAQNLAFERHRILAKLNAKLGLDLSDIRFSTAQWAGSPGSNPADAAVENSSEAAILWQNHPSRVQPVTNLRRDLGRDLPRLAPLAASGDPQAAFRDWARAVRVQSQHLPLCPACHSPTPPGELDRWAVCAHCAVRQFGETSRRNYSQSAFQPVSQAAEALKPDRQKPDH